MVDLPAFQERHSNALLENVEKAEDEVYRVITLLSGTATGCDISLCKKIYWWRNSIFSMIKKGA